jgi:hypothetical protein
VEIQSRKRRLNGLVLSAPPKRYHRYRMWALKTNQHHLMSSLLRSCSEKSTPQLHVAASDTTCYKFSFECPNEPRDVLMWPCASCWGINCAWNGTLLCILQDTIPTSKNTGLELHGRWPYLKAAMTLSCEVRAGDQNPQIICSVVLIASPGDDVERNGTTWWTQDHNISIVCWSALASRGYKKHYLSVSLLLFSSLKSWLVQKPYLNKP